MIILIPVSASAATDIQFALCERDGGRLAEQLGFSGDPAGSVVSYLDDPRLSFARKGLFLKVKEKKGAYTTELKMRSSGEVPGAECEIDRYGTERSRKCSLRHKGPSPVWTSSQRRAAGALEELPWERLPVLGSFPEERWKGAWELDPTVEVSFELLHLPGRGSIAEFSLRAELREEERVYRRARSWLQQRGIALCREQRGKIFRIVDERGFE